MSCVIFLDFDGVMHPVGTCIWNSEMQQMQSVDAFRWWPELEKALVAAPAPIELVIHSTWRLMWETDAELLAMLPVSMQPYVRETTDRTIMGRERSIIEYLAKNTVDYFLVLDDEIAAFAPGYAPLISCDGAQGISEQRALAALHQRLSQWTLL